MPFPPRTVRNVVILALAILPPRAAVVAFSSPYPVDPKVHMADDSLDPTPPGGVHSSVPNAFAYARYALALASGDAVEIRSDRDVLTTLDGIADRAPVSATRALVHYARALEEATKAAALARVAEGRDDVDVPATMNARVALLRAQVESCRVEEGSSEEECCRALLAPATLVEEWTKLDEEGRRIATGAAVSASFATRYVNARSGPLPTAGTIVRLQGVKAWLAACAVPIAGLPRDLDSLRARVGDWRSALTASPAPPALSPSASPASTWTVELHPTSRAKFTGRRIYRNETARVSIAESLAADCTVTETEVVWERPGRELLFASYSTHASGRNVEYGHFPGTGGRQAVKFTPDSCMGCHYTFDDRRFVVRAPSHAALNLHPRIMDGVPSARDDSHCALPGEPLVWHGR